jgi:rRNA processing protein Krr1/Pno1
VIVDNLEELRRLILVEKIDVNSTDSSGDTALHIAAAKGRREMVQFLIANGANVNLANNLGSTPLHKAALANQIFIVEFLVKHGADRNLKNKSGLLPEHLAHLPRIKEFLDGGQSVSEDLKIPREQHGRIIGPKGAVIRALREKTGASIIIPDKDAAGPGHITLRGRPAAVAAAKAAIYEVLATAPSLVIAEEGALNTEGSRSLPVSEGGKPSAAAAPQPRAPETTVNCPIPKEKHKKIVTAGELKKIIQETGVRVTVPSENNSDSLIKVEGTQAAVDKAVAWLYKITKDRVSRLILSF